MTLDEEVALIKKHLGDDADVKPYVQVVWKNMETANADGVKGFITSTMLLSGEEDMTMIRLATIRENAREHFEVTQRQADLARRQRGGGK